MHKFARTAALTAAACTVIGMSVAAAGPASATTHEPSIQRLIVANWTNHDLDMTVTTGDGTVIHDVVKAGTGWYPEADYSGPDTITVRDSQGIAYVGTYTYDGDWIAGHSDTTPRLRYTWHTGPYGGYDFR